MTHPSLAPKPRSVHFVVYGTPAPKGSKRGFPIHRKDGTTGVAMVESAGLRLKDWEGQVNSVLQSVALSSRETLEGPLSLYVSFFLPRPKSAPKSRLWPDRKPDLSKLLRAIEDPMTQTGLIRDDAQFVRVEMSKQYVSEGERPRAEVEIREVVPEL